MLIVFCLYK